MTLSTSAGPKTGFRATIYNGNEKGKRDEQVRNTSYILLV
jgi:hypothetical protein